MENLSLENEENNKEINEKIIYLKQIYNIVNEYYSGLRNMDINKSSKLFKDNLLNNFNNIINELRIVIINEKNSKGKNNNTKIKKIIEKFNNLINILENEKSNRQRVSKFHSTNKKY